MEFLQSHGQSARGPIDLLCLAAVPKPDVTLQQKYDAMGLPDPVAFAMLTALGAIPDPMALLNEMMAAAAPEEDEKATFWKGPQFAADADSAELERLAKQVKEAAEQARAATVATGAVAGTAEAARNVAQAFAQPEEEEPQRPAPLGTTLSSLLTGRERTQDSLLTLPTTLDKVALSRLPKGVTEAQVRLECARYGALTAVVLEEGTTNGSGVTAYVCYASSDMAQLAVRRMTGAKIGVFGNEPVQVKLISELPESVRSLAVPKTASAFSEVQPINPQQLPDYLRSGKASRSAGRKRASRSTRRKKRKSRSAKRWLDRSRSNSHTATGQYIRATGCSSTVRWWERRRDSDDSDDGRTKRMQQAEADLIAKRPRQVAIKGVWAQFVYSGSSYYFNIRTEQTLWETPDEFEDEKSKHQTNAII